MAAQRKGKKKRSVLGSGTAGCFTLFAIVWLGMIFAFDGFLLSGVYKLFDARQRFLNVPGVVTGSRVESHSDSDGTTYSAQVEYAYEVEGISYTGDRYSMFEFSTSGGKSAHSIVQRHPVGKDVVVYYDPRDHHSAALDLSDASVPYGILLFLLPFHCVGFGLFGSGIRGIWRSIRFGNDRAVAPLIAQRNKSRIVLRDSRWSGWSVFFVVCGVTSFVLIFVVAFAFDFTLKRQLAMWLFASCIGAGMLGATLSRMYQTRKGKLTIDRDAGRFTRSGGSRGVPFSAVRTVRLTTRGTSTRVNERPWYRHELSAIDHDGGEHELLVIKGFKEAGEDARDWFAELFEAHAEGEVPQDDSEPSMAVVSEVEINRTKT